MAINESVIFMTKELHDNNNRECWSDRMDLASMAWIFPCWWHL